MKSFIKKNKFFLASILLLCIAAIAYKYYKIGNSKNIKYEGKEVVSIFLKNDEITKGLPQLVEEYNETSDDIYIKLEFADTDYNNVVFTKLANEVGADIIQYMSTTLIDKEFIQPLDNLNVNYSNIDESYLLKLNNDVIGIKYGVSIPKLMYNDNIVKDIGLTQKPETLDELISVLEKIKDKNPEIIPLDITIANIHNLFSFIGNIASSDYTTYPTFWNYNSGRYDYNNLSIVIDKFKYMYNNNLINIDFDTKTQEAVYSDFQNEKSAITVVTSSKKYSVVDRTFNMNVSFSNIPVLKNGDEKKRYYGTSQRVLVLANNARDKEKLSLESKERLERHEKAVSEVFNWLLSKDVTSYLEKMDANYAAFASIDYGENGVYYEMNNDKNFYQLKNDPTELLAGNSKLIQDTVYAMIKGEIDINAGIEKLNLELNDFILNNERNKIVDLDMYKEQNNE
ncbi:ABC transporter substrate-binding protein [Clostridium sp. NSJ-145]|uniref:ABC transporter substrate-binding protein n=1 Tax=Clostridium sp. NSJ-145 TaxID=2897777 RepID=UPI001E4CD372|nr:ABC transporter substrate-binding protein [Clostridium sp. NSJ-145]MCD2502382.1 ABC transporter substrate-binding protein [Clostridium sp. NSJ-145]